MRWIAFKGTAVRDDLVLALGDNILFKLGVAVAAACLRVNSKNMTEHFDELLKYHVTCHNS